MLEGIRKRKNNLVYTFIIAATAAVMAMYGVGKLTNDHGGGAVAAYVNSDTVSRQEYEQQLESKMAQFQQYAGTQAEEFIKQLHIPERTLEELIQYKLFAQQARAMNIEVPDSELADHIRSLPYYQKDGKFDAETYSQLPNRGMAEHAQREQLRIQRLQHYLSERIRLTPAEIKAAYDLKNTKVDLDYAKIDFAATIGDAAPNASEISEYLKKESKADLQQYYDSHKKEFTDKASYHVRQIRTGIPYQASDAQKTSAKQKIAEIAKLANKDNFGEIAKTKSDDEYAKKGGDAGWISQGTLEPPLEVAIEKLKAGEISPPVETSFGYYLVQLVDKKPEVVHPFDSVKEKLATKQLAEKKKKTLAESKQKEWDQILAAGKPLDAELKKAKIEVKKTGPFSLSEGYIPQLGQADVLLDAVYDLTPDKPMAKKLFYHQNNFYYLKLRSVDYAKEADFAKNADSVEKTEAGELQSEVIMAWINAFRKQSTIKTELNFKNAETTAESE
jgi:peptidyl-prolyl cis-trans isomerase D